MDSNGRTIWIADAHRDDGKRFVVRADEKLAAFVELERAVCIHLLTEHLTGFPAERPRGVRSASNKARQITEMMVKASSITSSDVSTYLRHG
jgi:hypothetical protein